MIDERDSRLLIRDMRRAGFFISPGKIGREKGAKKKTETDPQGVAMLQAQQIYNIHTGLASDGARGLS